MLVIWIFYLFFFKMKFFEIPRNVLKNKLGYKSFNLKKKNRHIWFVLFPFLRKNRILYEILMKDKNKDFNIWKSIY